MPSQLEKDIAAMAEAVREHPGLAAYALSAYLPDLPGAPAVPAGGELFAAPLSPLQRGTGRALRALRAAENRHQVYCDRQRDAWHWFPVP